ncbi:MAG TPA: VanW family protein [Candidatus Agathobaculum pullicola]|nr:VanW family protein [Candidatus Agathobaculum pullicola]
MSILTNKQKEGTHVAKHTAQTVASKTGKKQKRVPLAAKITGGIAVLLLAVLCSFTYVYPNIFPGVTVGSIPVGGMTQGAATKQVSGKSKPLYQDAKLSLTIFDTTYDIPVSDVLQSVDEEQSVKNAYAVGRTGNPFARMWDVAKALVGMNEAQIAAQVDEDGLTEALEEISSKALTEPVEPTWEIGTNTMTIHAGKPGVKFDTDAVRSLLEDKIRLMDFEPYEVSTELTDTPAIDIDKIAEAVIGDPVSATVSKEDGKTIIPEKVGVQFDVEEARSIIGDGSAASYTIPVATTAVKVTAEDLKTKLFTDTLAQTSTWLDESNTPRTNNVRLASAAINGTILNPGDEFSYNNVVGERTEARGYKPAGAYSGGKIIEEFGGGVCQPSSTLYMAVLRADLEVTERHNHSFTVAYTPLGEDATVDYGNLDFRFKNNTDYPVKVLAEQTGGKMIMTIVGTKTSDKTVDTRTEVLETYTPQTIEKKDSSMMAGQTRVDITPITGYATRTYQVITENGKTTEVLANKSTYVKRDKVVYVGTKQPAPTTPQTPAPTTPQTPETEGASTTETPSDGASATAGESGTDGGTSTETAGDQTQADS